MKNRILVILGAASIAVCTTPHTHCACEPSRTHVIVYGIVRTSAGAAVPGAVVAVVPAPEGATIDSNAADRLANRASSASDGSYHIDAVSYFTPTQPLTVIGTAFTASADTARAEAAGGSLRPLGNAPDSVRLDIVFP